MKTFCPGAAEAGESFHVRKAGIEATLSLPPVRPHADGEAALSDLLRIGSGLGTRVSRRYSVRDGLLSGILLGIALVLAVVGLGALL